MASSKGNSIQKTKMESVLSISQICNLITSCGDQYSDTGKKLGSFYVAGKSQLSCQKHTSKIEKSNDGRASGHLIAVKQKVYWGCLWSNQPTIGNETLYGELAYRRPANMNTRSCQVNDGEMMISSDGDEALLQLGQKSGMASSRGKFQVTILNKIFQGGRDYAPALSAQWCSRLFAWFDEQAVPKVRLRKCAKSARFSSDPLMASEYSNNQTPNLESEICGFNSKVSSFISLFVGIIYLATVFCASSETVNNLLQPITPKVAW